MSAEQGARLAEFARSCKTAARSVALYPGTHPAIRAALGRLVAAADRLTAAGDVTIDVHPDGLLIDGRAASKPDSAIGELAALLHERLVGALRIERGADADDWLALLLLLARAPEELVAAGGISRAWTATGRQHFAIREIDYAEVLRERAGGAEAEWDQIIAYCLEGHATSLDDRALAALVEALGDSAQFGELVARLQSAASEGGASLGVRTAALMQLLRAAIDAVEQRGTGREAVLQIVADAMARLTPDMMLAMLSHIGPLGAGAGAFGGEGDAGPGTLAAAILARMTDRAVASFVARSVAAECGATERLARAFEALVPDRDRRDRLLDLAHEEARDTEFGREAAFEELWHNAAEMLRSYSDSKYVSEVYGQELTRARTQAIEVERVSDDPPERVQAWVATVSDEAVRRLDCDLLVDLLRIETDPARWQGVAAVVVAEIERRTLLSDAAGAGRLAAALVADAGPDGREPLRAAAQAARDRLASGPLVRHLLIHFRKLEDADIEPLERLCQTVGPAIVHPLAEALAAEENSRAIRRLRELLLSFGTAGRQSVEQLKNSSNPAVRRTAIDLLRVFGGSEALPELASMLHDSDPQVQGEAIRAIVQIATDDAYAVLEKALVAGSASRDIVLQELIGLRDDKAIPLLCHVLNHTQPRGRMVRIHAEMIEALGHLSPHPESTRTLRAVLYRGWWWAPFRTAAFRRAAATALRRTGSPEAMAILHEAASAGRWGVRRVARAHAAFAARREGEPA